MHNPQNPKTPKPRIYETLLNQYCRQFKTDDISLVYSMLKVKIELKETFNIY